MRTANYLKERYRTILCYTGMILGLTSLLLFTPLLALLAWPQETGLAAAFIVPGLVQGLVGMVLWRKFRPVKAILSVPEAGVIVLLCWSLICLFSAWPLMAGYGLNFTQAVFESVSGWTTTGLSVIDVEKASHVTLLWRSIMQLAGGAGLAIIMLAAITGPVGSGLSMAEGREHLVPHVHQSAKMVLLIYAGYAAAGIIAYPLLGMGFFDAVNHTFAAISTGGFATHAQSIGYWDSFGIEAVTMILMVLGNLNFVTAYLLVTGKFKAVARNGEIKLMALLIPLSGALVFMLTARGLYGSLAKSLRVALFETVSALTTTGFSTVGYSNWNPFGVFVLIVLMLIGGGICSTAGGIKQYRVYLLFKSLVWELRRPFFPRTAVVENYVWEGERKVFIDDARLRQVSVFVFVYMAIYIIGSGIISAYGYSLKDSLFEFASALGTVGLSVGITTPDAPPVVLWTQTMGMFLGRLEFFVILTSALKLIRDSWEMLR